MTFYRWLESPTEVNKKFREHLERIRPDERYADAIEAAHMKKLVDKDSGGDVAAIIFGLKTKAKHRGWNEREFVIRNEAEADEVAKLKSAIADRAQALGITYQEELRKFLSMFGKQLAEPVVEKLEGEL